MRPWPWCDFGIRLWPRSLAGPFSLLKNEHLAQVLVYPTRGQLYFWYLLKLIQYDTPGPMRLADWASGPLSLLQNKHLTRVLAEQHSGPFVHLEAFLQDRKKIIVLLMSQSDCTAPPSNLKPHHLVNCLNPLFKFS